MRGAENPPGEDSESRNALYCDGFIVSPFYPSKGNEVT